MSWKLFLTSDLKQAVKIPEDTINAPECLSSQRTAVWENFRNAAMREVVVKMLRVCDQNRKNIIAYLFSNLKYQ